jgi:hypothetical protein
VELQPTADMSVTDRTAADRYLPSCFMTDTS